MYFSSLLPITYPCLLIKLRTLSCRKQCRIAVRALGNEQGLFG